MSPVVYHLPKNLPSFRRSPRGGGRVDLYTCNRGARERAPSRVVRKLMMGHTHFFAELLEQGEDAGTRYRQRLLAPCGERHDKGRSVCGPL
jgi:hypothetical protein